ncbi:winged helix-turn-helix transcriptional regulator [Candidatus Woesearchaeota archaeon]|nr:winged helix-turn-helix transcriptional regulator [Candidatus Woesearchaeota archaeon]
MLHRDERMKKVLEVLQQNARTHILDIARQLNIPKSTVFDDIQRIKEEYDFTIQKKIKPEWTQ